MRRKIESIILAILLCGLATLVGYRAILAVLQERWSWAMFGLGAAICLIALARFSVLLSYRSLARRRIIMAPSQPWLHSLASTVLPRAEVQYRPRKVCVSIDGQLVSVDLGTLWDYLIYDVAHGKSVLPWERYVHQKRMPLHEWKAYRQALIRASCVDVTKRGDLRLQYQPWEAVERVCVEYRLWIRILRWIKPAAKFYKKSQ